MIKLLIPCRLPGLNDIIGASNHHYHALNSLKKKWQKIISQYILVCQIPVFTEPLSLHFYWYEENRRRDLDNVSSGGRKFILDALRDMGKIPDDSRKYIENFVDHFPPPDKKNPRVEVIFRPSRVLLPTESPAAGSRARPIVLRALRE